VQDVAGIVERRRAEIDALMARCCRDGGVGNREVADTMAAAARTQAGLWGSMFPLSAKYGRMASSFFEANTHLQEFVRAAIPWLMDHVDSGDSETEAMAQSMVRLRLGGIAALSSSDRRQRFGRVVDAVLKASGFQDLCRSLRYQVRRGFFALRIHNFDYVARVVEQLRPLLTVDNVKCVRAGMAMVSGRSWGGVLQLFAKRQRRMRCYVPCLLR
jgi:hypothetical protein